MATNPAELARDQLAELQRASRAATRARLEAQFSGNPAAYQAAYEGWAPVVEFYWDMKEAPVDEIDSVVRNQNLEDL